MTFEEFLKSRDIVEHGSIRVSDCRAAWDTAGNAAKNEVLSLVAKWLVSVNAPQKLYEMYLTEFEVKEK